ncbi:ribonuclease H-like domain-containing protein [Tanacetum coccineum]|uniref:Ribonuclease H-like domain-containing protein n=1 Tax=Tanacetum coccineum TaxID=301880 RepID=A0ABQ5G7R4_9ASTR
MLDDLLSRARVREVDMLRKKNKEVKETKRKMSLENEMPKSLDMTRRRSRSDTQFKHHAERTVFTTHILGNRPGSVITNINTSLFEDATKRQRTSAPTSELGQYMATNFLITLSPEEFANFDILAWWKEREIQFPILSAMARDLLAVQASTVASESAFSTSGRIISERRSRLTPESVEVCVCLKDYLDGVDRVQHETSLEGPILEDVEETIAREEVDLGISPPNTELDEGEFEDLDIVD